MPTPKGRITLRLQRCPAMPRAAGCVYTRRPRTIWLRLGAGDPRGTLLHELGHTYDLLVLSNHDRAAVSRILHRGRRAWWKGPIPTAEWFAEGYSWCAPTRGSSRCGATRATATARPPRSTGACAW